VVIIRRGYLVAEWYENGAGRRLASTSIPAPSRSPHGVRHFVRRCALRRLATAVDLDSRAYAYIPAGHPLTDPRKEHITLRHLLSMSSGIPGESIGAYGVRTRRASTPLRRVGFQPVLAGAPTSSCGFPISLPSPASAGDYCDPAFAHLALAFREIAGQELAHFMDERVFRPIGIESLTWEKLGLDDGESGNTRIRFRALMSPLAS